jgi:SH3-like domain-containing protein
MQAAQRDEGALTGMRPSLDCWFPQRLDVAPRLTALSTCACARVWAGVILISLMAAILPWQTLAETTSTALSYTLEQTSGPLRRGIITRLSNLRASPSLHSEIVAVAKEGTRVQILLESGRWFRVRNEEGVEAWINKRLVLIDRGSIKDPSGTPEAAVPSDIAETTSAVAATPEVFVEFHAARPPEEPESGASPAAPIDEPEVLPQVTWVAWFLETWLSHLRGPAVYVSIALGLLLVLSVTLQLRSSRQLRRTLQDMGQILDLVEEVYGTGVLARTSDSSAALPPMPAEDLAQQPGRPGIEFSPLEYAVLEALSDQREVQEAELGKVLAEKGFTGVLIKAVIGDILRKTGIFGLPWMEVRYAQGRYRYRLRPEAMPHLSEQRLENP